MNGWEHISILKKENGLIKHERGKYVLYSRDGTRKLFSSTSYQACVNREAQIKKIIAAKKAEKDKK